MSRRDRAKPSDCENFEWEIIYHKTTKKPLYYNKTTKKTSIWRPMCPDNSGCRISIKQPVIQALYKDFWYKGILLGPEDKNSFLVELDNAPVGILTVHRNEIREWSQKMYLPTSMKLEQRNLGRSHSQSETLKVEVTVKNVKKASAFLDGDDYEESLSQLSDQPLPCHRFSCDDEKSDVESPILLVHPSLQLDDFKTDESVRSSRCSKSGDDEESDWTLPMTPIQTFPKRQSKRRKERMNAVLLDYKNLEDESKPSVPTSGSNSEINYESLETLI